MKQMKREKTAILFVALSILPTIGCAGTRPLSPPNSAVTWSGTFVGIMPQVDEARVSPAIRKGGPEVCAQLVRDLEREDRYISAHVLLTELCCSELVMMDDQWNGLHVILNADGSVQYDARDMPVLQRWWQDFFAKSNPSTTQPEK